MRKQTELQRRVQQIVDDCYKGNRRDASRKVVGHSLNIIGQILDNENQIPKLETLQAIANAFGWRFYDVVCWAMDLEPEMVEPAPEAEVRRGLGRMGVPANEVDNVLRFARNLAELAELKQTYPANNAN